MNDKVGDKPEFQTNGIDQTGDTTSFQQVFDALGGNLSDKPAFNGKTGRQLTPEEAHALRSKQTGGFSSQISQGTNQTPVDTSLDVLSSMNLSSLAAKIIVAPGVMSSTAFISEKGIDINRVSIGLRSLGELAFLADRNSDGVLTRGEALQVAMDMRNNPAMKSALNGENLNMLLQFIPEEGLTKRQLIDKIDEIESGMKAADANHDGFIGQDEPVVLTQELQTHYANGLHMVESATNKRSNTLSTASSLLAERMPRDAKEFDENKDGSVTLSEVIQTLKHKFKEVRGKEANDHGSKLPQQGIQAIPDGQLVEPGGR